MPFQPGYIYHVYNQGNNKQRIFLNRRDYLTFLTLYKKLFPGYCSTIAWCLMPNHFHFMIHTDDRCNMQIKQGGIYIDPVTNCIRKLLSGYARIFNNNYHQTGSVFRQKTKSKCLTDVAIQPNSQYLIRDYYVNCFHYIHQNPVVAKLVDRFEEWEFSSFREYAGLRQGTLCEKELASIHCNYQPDLFISESYKMVEEKMERFFL